MHWLLAVLIGHLFNAIAFVIDKILLTKAFQNPFVYAFFIGALGSIVFVLIPFGVEIPEAGLIVLNLVAGALFIVALLFFFHALKGAEASRIVPFIGGGIPLFTLAFEHFFLEGGVSLTTRDLIAFGILVLGTVMIAVELGDNANTAEEEQPEAMGLKAWIYGVLAALAFAVSFGMTKIAYDTQPFISAFTWMRFGSLAVALLFLLSSNVRKEIAQAFGTLKTKTGALFLGSQAMGGLGFVCINYAISLASVSLVNALQGVQYAFLLILAVVASLKYPKMLQESMNKKTLILKSVAVVVIGVGLYMVSIGL